MLNENAKLVVQLSAYIVMLEQTVQQLQTQLKEANAKAETKEASADKKAK